MDVLKINLTTHGSAHNRFNNSQLSSWPIEWLVAVLTVNLPLTIELLISFDNHIQMQTIMISKKCTYHSTAVFGYWVLTVWQKVVDWKYLWNLWRAAWCIGQFHASSWSSIMVHHKKTPVWLHRITLLPRLQCYCQQHQLGDITPCCQWTMLNIDAKFSVAMN